MANQGILPPAPLRRQVAMNFVRIHNGQQVLPYEVERNVNGVDMVTYGGVQYPIENDANGLRRIVVNGVARYIVENNENNVGGRSKRNQSKRNQSKRKQSKRKQSKSKRKVSRR